MSHSRGVEMQNVLTSFARDAVEQETRSMVQQNDPAQVTVEIAIEASALPSYHLICAQRWGTPPRAFGVRVKEDGRKGDIEAFVGGPMRSAHANACVRIANTIGASRKGGGAVPLWTRSLNGKIDEPRGSRPLNRFPRVSLVTAFTITYYTDAARSWTTEQSPGLWHRD